MPRGIGCIVCGKPGIGKTSFALEWPKPLTCVSLYETGFDDLKALGEVPEGVNGFNITDYQQLVSLVSQPCRTLVIDSLSGFQQIYFDYLIKTLYDGVAKKFTAYYTGPRQDAPANILPFMNTLTYLLQKGTNVVLVAHERTEKIENPLGLDYVKSEIDIDDGIRLVFYKWAPNILFMNFESDVSKSNKVTSTSAPTRLIYTTSALQHCAKNKLHLPIFIPMGDKPRQAFENFWDKVPSVYKQ